MKVKFIKNPYIKASWQEVTFKLTVLTNEYLDNTKSKSGLLKKAKNLLYKLGWSLEEYQTLNRPPKRK
jgi:hypothetical protein